MHSICGRSLYDMAEAVVIEIDGLERLQKQLAKAPDIVRSWLNKAIQASIFEIEAEAVDENFLFKTPRALRTGLLQRSFKFGMSFGDLWGQIGPTVAYAPFVHKGNPFMGRIVNKAKPKIGTHFDDALEGIAKEIA